MIGLWPPSAKFFQDLLDFDEFALEQARRAGCRRCRGRLDRADYRRKPRGLPPAWESVFVRRFSFCCSREGCRARCTPPSVRFLGRRVYVGAVVIVASIAWLFGVPVEIVRRTVRRWTTWWTTAFVGTALWWVERSRFMPPVDDARLPVALFDRFAQHAADDEAALSGVLVFISPLTSASASFSRDGHGPLTLDVLNQATAAWFELEYNRRVHSETGQTPIERLLAGPDVSRKSPSSDELRRAFRTEQTRAQRHSDGIRHAPECAALALLDFGLALVDTALHLEHPTVGADRIPSKPLPPRTLFLAELIVDASSYVA